MVNLYLLQKITLGQYDEEQTLTELSANIGRKFTVSGDIHDVKDNQDELFSYLSDLENTFPRQPKVLFTTSGNDLVVDIGEIYYCESSDVPSLSGYLVDKLSTWEENKGWVINVPSDPEELVELLDN